MQGKGKEDRMDLSVCIIAKNEENNIGRCLKCLAPYGFEVVVADTGSDDRTVEIAREYQANVYSFAWCDDFAAAKNFAVSKASHPYVLVLDADEFVEELDDGRLAELIASHPEEVGRIRRRNVFTRNGLGQENREWINRIFAKESFCYEGRIHEQVTARDGGAYDTYEAPVVILHTGYDLTGEERKRKTERNIILLERELEELERQAAASPDGAASCGGQTERQAAAGEQIPYILYQLGKSHYMAQDYAAACDYFSRGLSYDLDPRLEYVIDMVETYGYALLNSGQTQEALFFENIYHEFGKSADFLFLMGLIFMKNARFSDAVQEFLKATSYRECRNQGVNSYAAFYNIGVIYECLGDLAQAKEFYRKSGDYAPAEARLQVLRKML